MNPSRRPLFVLALAAFLVAASPPEAGSARLEVPDLSLVDHLGRPISFYRDLVAGKVVAMNFIFTSCTTVCPPMGAAFGRLQTALGDHFGKDVTLVSVSVDPVTDTPERLRAWSRQFEARPGWTLVTGDRATVQRLLKELDVFTANAADHTPMVLLIDDQHGRWQRASGLTAPERLAELLTQMAIGQPAPEQTTQEGAK